MSTPNKRRAFSLEFKKEVIDAAEKNGNQSALARQFKIPESSVEIFSKSKNQFSKQLQMEKRVLVMVLLRMKL
uniref:Transposase n=1 Tax=Ditylenchus dipsaci TaxID=166011 RepID=A0A915DDL2_9BILA